MEFVSDLFENALTRGWVFGENVMADTEVQCKQLIRDHAVIRETFHLIQIWCTKDLIAVINEIESDHDRVILASAGALHVAELAVFGIERATVAKEAALIYEQSFPSFERIDAQLIFEAPEAGRRVLLAQSDERIEGFVSLRAIPNHDAYLLEYLAVAPASRSGGVGTLLVRRASLLAREDGANQLFMELEDPEGQTSSHDSVRRVKFYEGLDCEKVPWLTNYVVPDFTQPSQAIPLLLYCKELRDPAVQYEPTGMLAAMYEMAYGESGAALLPRMLEQVVTAPN